MRWSYWVLIAATAATIPNVSQAALVLTAETVITGYSLQAGPRPQDIDAFGNVVFTAGIGDTQNVYRYDQLTHLVSPVTSGAQLSLAPVVSGNNIAWRYQPGPGSTTQSLRYTDGTTTQTIISDRQIKGHDIDGSTIAWTDETGVHKFDIATGQTQTIRSVTGLAGSRPPSVDGDDIVWVERGTGLFHFDGSSISLISTNIDQNTFTDVFAGKITWSVGGDIWLWDGSAATKIHDATASGIAAGPKLYSDKVVYFNENPTFGASIVANDFSEIFVLDIGIVSSLVSFDNDWVAYQRVDGTSRNLVVARITEGSPVPFPDPNPNASVPEPTTVATWLLLGGIGLAVGRRRRKPHQL